MPAETPVESHRKVGRGEMAPGCPAHVDADGVWHIEDYADAIASVLNKLPARKRPLLRLESGRCLVDEAGYLLTSVVAVKGVNRASMVGADLSGRGVKERIVLSEDSRVGYVIDAVAAGYILQGALDRMKSDSRA